jgi:hypothetical protein
MLHTKHEIVNDMCLTYNHAYFLPTKADDDTRILNCALTASEKEFLYRQMNQIFTNSIEPFMEFKNV